MIPDQKPSNELGDLESLILDETPLAAATPRDEAAPEDDTKRFHRLTRRMPFGSGEEAERLYQQARGQAYKELAALFENKLRVMYAVSDNEVNARLQTQYDLLREEYTTMYALGRLPDARNSVLAVGYRPGENVPSILCADGKSYCRALRDDQWFAGPVLAIYFSARDLGNNQVLNLNKAMIANVPKDIAPVLENVP